MLKVVAIFKRKFFENLVPLLGELKIKLPAEVKIYFVDFSSKEIEKAKEFLKRFSLEKNIVLTGEDIEDILKKENPYLVVLPRPKMNPLLHAFKKAWSEKEVEETSDYNFLLIDEGTTEIKKALVYVDTENTSENYIREVYNFLTRLKIEFKFFTVFDEHYYEFLIKKDHPETEARQILGQMFEDYVHEVMEKIKKALSLEHVEVISTKGELRKALPFFAAYHRFDIFFISHSLEDKDAIVENAQTSVGIFKN